MTYADENKNTFSNYSGNSELYKKQPFDLDEMRAHLEEFPEIAYVAFPHTWYGYGTDFVCLANNEYLKTYYAGMTEEFQCQLFVPKECFLNASEDSELEDLAELFFYTQNEYALIGEEIHSRMVYEAKIELLNSEIRYELELEEDEIEDLFQKLEIDYSEWVSIDNDGYTVYALKGDLQELFELLKTGL